MGNCLANTPEGEVSSQIERELKKNAGAARRENKLLLLGPGESGKSTIVKQLRIINTEGDKSRWISDEERIGFKSVIHSNTILSMSALLKALQKDERIDQLDEENQQNAALLLSPEINATPELSPDVADAVKSLWDQKIIRDRFKNKSDVQIIDSASYFFDNIERVAKADYIPTDQDILYSRTRTSGITEFCFNLAGTMIRLVDVGGQRSERRKWIHCFDEVTCIFFIVAVSEFDQKLREDESTNRLREAFILFKEVSEYDAFKQIPIILFLNKKDLFEEKIQRVNFSSYFPEYKEANDFDTILKWVEMSFRNVGQARGDAKIWTHATCATNTENVETVFGAVQNIFMSKTLETALVI